MVSYMWFTQASILLQVLHLHAFTGSHGEVTKKTLLRGNMIENEKALGSSPSYTVTWQKASVQNISAHTFPASIEMIPFPYKSIKKGDFKPKLLSPHYKWGGVGDSGLFNHNTATSTFGKGGPLLLGCSQLKKTHPIALSCLAGSAVYACFLSSFQKSWKESTFFWGVHSSFFGIKAVSKSLDSKSFLVGFLWRLLSKFPAMKPFTSDNQGFSCLQSD